MSYHDTTGWLSQSLGAFFGFFREPLPGNFGKPLVLAVGHWPKIHQSISLHDHDADWVIVKLAILS